MPGGPDPGAAEGLAAFLGLLLRANEEINLVSRREAVPETLVERHLRDSLEALSFLPGPSARPLRLLDVGSGGGFPAIPILLCRRDVEGVLVESTGKKARFLEGAIRALGLTARVVNARFPDPALELMRKAPHCDLLTTRAVAGAGEIVRAARPALVPGALALLWTTEPLLPEIRRALPGAAVVFRKSPGADRRGLARVECFT
jgi:16S rRNA (guanine527-N7)-methyltransferase